jgi:hypothetical protein
MTRPEIRPSDEVLTRKQTMEILHLKPAFFSKVINGRVPGIPPLDYIRVGRKLLFLKASVDRWLIEMEQITCRRAHSKSSKTAAA